jgi:hypothetical protein
MVDMMLIYSVYKLEYRIFKLVEITLRELKYKEEK